MARLDKSSNASQLGNQLAAFDKPCNSGQAQWRAAAASGTPPRGCFAKGGINIVVNTEKEGLAHSSYLVHGACAYAFGLKVDDAAATVARARALGAEPFEQRHGPDELAIPAIRGVGGGVIYFIDGRSELTKVWEIEFEPVDDAGNDAGLMAIDHLAQSMNYEEMLTWLLFCTAIFRTTKLPMVDVIDPPGVVGSWVVESDDGGLRPKRRSVHLG